MNSPTVSVRPTTPSDIDSVLSLQDRVYPSIDPWHRDHLAHQLTVFPEGQLVAVSDGEIVGCASSLVILWDEWADEHTWHDITSAGTFSSHNPDGFTLYGAEVFVDSIARGKGVGHHLYEGRRQLCKRLNLRRIIACGRLPGYHRHAQAMTVELYAKKVLWGDLTDAVLNFQLREGFRYCGIMKDYLPEDLESAGQASPHCLDQSGLRRVASPTSLPRYSQGIEAMTNTVSTTALQPVFSPSQGIVRIAAVQYLLRNIQDWDGFENQVRFVMKAAGEYKPQFVMFPEIFTTQLLSFIDTSDLKAAVRKLDEFTGQYVALFVELAQQWGVHIIGGTHPTIVGEKLLNRAYLFSPAGSVFTQDKIHLTRWEKEKWKGDHGDHLSVFDTPYGRIAILICYDIEFPELSRMVCEQGADIIFVPSCTDDRQGFWRVRYCCHARAIENQVFVAVTGTVGNLAVEGLGLHFGQAAIITPSDFPFARDGIAAEGMANSEQIVIADVDLAKLVSNRVNGTTIPLYDKRKDVYDNGVEIIATT